MYLFLERREGEEDRERNIEVREKHLLLAFPTPDPAT